MPRMDMSRHLKNWQLTSTAESYQNSSWVLLYPVYKIVSIPSTATETVIQGSTDAGDCKQKTAMFIKPKQVATCFRFAYIPEEPNYEQ